MIDMTQPLALRAFLGATCLLLALPVLSLESDQYEPIKIQADAAIVDDSSGSSVYRGNVTIDQGTLHVSADEVEILTANGEVIQIIARMDTGSDRSAHYEQQMNPARDMVFADASKITYLIQEDRLHLSGNARLQQVEDIFTGELLYYDISRGIVNLSSGANKEDRVKMTITPRKKPQ